ncbi:hypothetical protein [Actinoallomurus purpureus]|nr:hypothetical protein [Actinoallomurus purpureus]
MVRRAGDPGLPGSTISSPGPGLPGTPISGPGPGLPGARIGADRV